MGKDAIVIRMDGHGIPEILDAILQVFPLDTYAFTPLPIVSFHPCYHIGSVKSRKIVAYYIIIFTLFSRFLFAGSFLFPLFLNCGWQFPGGIYGEGCYCYPDGWAWYS